MTGNNNVSLTAQDYINIITDNSPGFAPLDAPPPPDQAPVAFDGRHNLTVLLRKVSDAASAVMSPTSDSGSHWCNHCTHRLTGTFHVSAVLPRFMTYPLHYTKKREELSAAIDALPEGDEKSLAKAFEKAATYTYCLQEARMATKPSLQSALVDIAAKAAGALPDKTEDLKIECAAGTGDFASSGLLYKRLDSLHKDLKSQLTRKMEDLKTSSVNSPPAAAQPSAMEDSTSQPLQVGKPLTLVRKPQNP